MTEPRGCRPIALLLQVRTATCCGNRNLQLSVLRLMPRDEMRDANVEGFMASNSAAPLGPETFPLVCFRAFIIVSRSCRFNSSRVRSAASAAGLGCSVFRRVGEAG